MVSSKIRSFIEEGGWIRRMFETGIALKKKYGEDKVFDLSLGNPVLEPPEAFKRELKRIANNNTKGTHRYMPNAGYPETREAIAASLRKETGLPFAMEDVVMTCGAAGAINVIIKTILEPGDEVIIFAPHFVEYRYYVDNHGGASVVAPTDKNFLPDLTTLEKLLSPRTRAVLVNSPNNPTGVLYPSSLLTALGELLSRAQSKHGHEIFLISDEPYRRILFDGLIYPHIYRFHEASIVAYSHSKDLGLPGERIGYIAVNPAFPKKRELVDGLVFCNRILGYVNAPALMQRLVRHIQDASVDVADYQRKRDYLYTHLTDMGYKMVKPQGAFYMFPRSPIEDDVAFVQELQKHNVLVVPGRGFGTSGYFRIAYCVEDWVLKGAMEGFAKAAAKYKL